MNVNNLSDVPVKVGTILERIGSSTAVVSGGLGLTDWLAQNHEWLAGLGVIVGIFIGITGLIVNVYFQHRRIRVLENSKL